MQILSLRKFMLEIRFSKRLQPPHWEHTDILDFFFWGAREQCIFPSDKRHSWCFRWCSWEKPQLWILDADCAALGQCFTLGLMGSQLLDSNTMSLFLLHFVISAHDPHRWSSQLPLVGLSGENVRYKPYQRDKSPCCGEEWRRSQMDEAHTEWPRLDKCVDAVTHAILGTKETVVPMSTTHSPLVNPSQSTRNDSDNTVLFSPSAAGSGQPGSHTQNGFLFEHDRKYGFSRELKSKI